VSSHGESWIEKVRRRTEREPDGWLRVAGLTLTEAEQVLDWLDNQNCLQHELTFHATEGCTVRWRVSTSTSPYPRKGDNA
jgi:hypothetical protein